MVWCVVRLKRSNLLVVSMLTITLGGVMVAIVGAVRVPGQTKAQTLEESAPDPRATFEQARQALASGNYPAAERGFREVLQLDPGSVSATTNLGVAYLRSEIGRAHV